MGTTVIYHKNEDDDERDQMEHDYQELIARNKSRSLTVRISNKWNKMVEAIVGAASFSAFRERLANRKNEEEEKEE